MCKPIIFLERYFYIAIFIEINRKVKFVVFFFFVKIYVELFRDSFVIV